MVEADKKIKKEDFSLNIEEMTKAGLHFGHRTSRVHPRMKPYLYGARNTIHIIDLTKTLDKFREALSFIENFILEGKTILFVGTKIQAKDFIKEVAKECGFPYVNERWLGGTFTNFEILKKRVEHLKNLEKDKAEGNFEKYTKKEQIKLNREMENLEIKFGGVRELNKLPEAIFVADIKKDHLAVKEAKIKGIKIIGVVDTNTDPDLCDYPILANDDARSSIKYILDKIKETILTAKNKSENQEKSED